MLLDKGFKADCASLMQIVLRTPPASRFESLLKQRHFQVAVEHLSDIICCLVTRSLNRLESSD